MLESIASWLQSAADQLFEIPSVPQALANGAVMAGVLWLLFIKQERRKERRRRTRHARSMLNELDAVWDALFQDDGERPLGMPDADTIEYLPRATYDGLVSSTEISLFTLNLQTGLRRFYNDLGDYRLREARQSIFDLMEDVREEMD